jgi:hypothetical protein
VHMIHFFAFYFIVELIGVFCLQLGAVGGRQNGCETVFSRRW